MQLSSDERPILVRFALAFALVIVGWAVLHDLHLITVEPRHFTVYHRPLLPIHSHALLAVQYALVASFGPGIAFGFLAYFAARGGTAPKSEFRVVLCGFVAVLILVELVLLTIGSSAKTTFSTHGTTLFPKNWYPELTASEVYTQTVNIGAYLFAPLSGVAYLLVVRMKRRR